MRVIDEFLQPILNEAIAKRRTVQSKGKEAAEEEHDTLLDHLVQLTDGEQCHYVILDSGVVTRHFDIRPRPAPRRDT